MPNELVRRSGPETGFCRLSSELPFARVDRYRFAHSPRTSRSMRQVLGNQYRSAIAAKLLNLVVDQGANRVRSSRSLLRGLTINCAETVGLPARMAARIAKDTVPVRAWFRICAASSGPREPSPLTGNRAPTGVIRRRHTVYRLAP